MSTSKTVRALTRALIVVALVATAALAGTVFSPGDDSTVEAAPGLDASQLGAGGEYHALTPTRILDTRESKLDVAPPGRKPTSASPIAFDVAVSDIGGLPPFVDADKDGNDDNVLAVAVNITVVNPSQLGFLRAFGKGSPEGETSVVNFAAGEFVPNMAILRPGKDGMISVRVFTPIAPGTTDVVIDLFGWFSSSGYDGGADGDGRGARLKPAGPGRIFDSRKTEFGGTQLGPRSYTPISIRGADSYNPATTNVVPDNTNVVGVLINITGVNIYAASAPTFISVVPQKLAGIPTTSNLNLATGQVRSVMAMVPVGDDGSIQVYNLNGEVDVIIDVMGYLINGEDGATREGRVVPLVAPFRAFDTRRPEFHDQPLAPANAEDWSFKAFVDDVKIGSTSVGPQIGLLGNLTATALQRQYSWAPVSSFLTAYPAGSGDLPSVSNITIAEGQTMPNLALLRFGGDAEDPYQVRVYNLAGYVDYLFDVSAVILAD